VGGLVGLVAGAITFFIAGRMAKSFFARHVAKPSVNAGDAGEYTAVREGTLGAVYFAVFIVLLLATLAGTYFGRWLVA